jgi:hypothetical protein
VAPWRCADAESNLNFTAAGGSPPQGKYAPPVFTRKTGGIFYYDTLADYFSDGQMEDK